MDVRLIPLLFVSLGTYSLKGRLPPPDDNTNCFSAAVSRAERLEMAKTVRRTSGTKRTLLSRVRRLPKPEDALNAPALLEELARAAEQYVNKTPKQQRLAADRQRLLDLLTRVQLFLSVDKSTHQTG